MNRYGLVAINAVKSILSREESDPLLAWINAASDEFGLGSHSQSKGCPKNAFIGVCEEGLVKDIPSGKYTLKNGAEKNKSYAIKAVQILRSEPEMAMDKQGLWKKVLNGEEKSHNSQMDVVLALWNNNFIDRNN